MAIYNSFEAFDSSLQHDFIYRGFVVAPCSNLAGLEELRLRFRKWVSEFTGYGDDHQNESDFFDN